MTTESNAPDDDREPFGMLEMEWNDETQEGYAPYRSVSKAAVSALLLTMFALMGLVFPVLLGGAVIAIILGLVAHRNLRRYPDELTGRAAAAFGMLGGIVVLAGGTVMHTYIYLTEVPEGYQRISFQDLQPKQGSGAMPGMAQLPFDLDGQRVFVKGYVHPGVADMAEIKNFVLVPDMGTCCFGGQPKLTDMIEVTITGPQSYRYAPIKRRLAGTFHVSDRLKRVVGGLDGGYYALEADYAK